jgi:hypothetical protein
VQAMAFSKMTNKVSVMGLDFSQILSQKYCSFPTHKQERITMTEKYHKFPVPSKHHV